MSEREALDALFNPRNIALVGASEKRGKLGFVLLDQILSSNFRGEVLPVNPGRTSVMGLRTYRHLNEIEKRVDLVLFAVPSEVVLDVLKTVAPGKAKVGVVYASGFSESGRTELERELLFYARKAKMRIIGPNCAGVINTSANLNLSMEIYPKQGGIAIVSQSGGIGGAIMHYLRERELGVSKFISYGNALDVQEWELIEYLAEDDETDVICIYIEGLKGSGEKFRKSLEQAKLRKKVVVLKAARTQAGRRACLTHTGSLAGSYDVFKGLMRQIKVPMCDSLYDIALYCQIASKRHAKVNKLEKAFVLTNSGGAGVVASDLLEEHGFKMAQVSPTLKDELGSLLPPYLSVQNPLDLGPNAGYDEYYRALTALSKEDVDVVLSIYIPTVYSDVSQVLDAVLESSRAYEEKVLLFCYIGGPSHRTYFKKVLGTSVPVFPSVIDAVRALKLLKMEMGG